MDLKSNKKLLAAILIGIVLEWYSYSMFGFLAPILANSFFPHKSQLASLLLIFITYFAGFVAGPLGAVVFGHLGDRLGRKYVLTKSIALMAISTGLIAVLPNYYHIGIWSGILLTLFVMLQGFAISGEDNASTIILIESFAARYRALLSSMVISAYGLGGLISTVVGMIVTVAAWSEWAWRLAFILGCLLGLVGLYLRLKIFETPAFIELKEQKRIEGIPLIKLFSVAKSKLINAVGIICLQAASVTLNLTFMNTYLVITKHWTTHHAMYITSISLITSLMITPYIGYLANQVGLRKLLLIVCLIYTIAAYPIYFLLQTDSQLIIILATLFLAILTAAYSATVPAYVCSLFPVAFRFSGVAIANNISWTLFGGCIPMLATLLLHITKTPTSPAAILLVAAICSLITLSLAKKAD